MTKICLVCSPGGHLIEMLQLINAFKDYDLVLITHYERLINGIETLFPVKIYQMKYQRIKLLPIDLLLYLIKAGLMGFKVLRKENPQVIVTNGAQIAIPISYLAKLFGKRVIYIESLARVNDLSGTGKLIYPIADLFLVQWEGLLKRYKRAKYWGKVI